MLRIFSKKPSAKPNLRRLTLYETTGINVEECVLIDLKFFPDLYLNQPKTSLSFTPMRSAPRQVPKSKKKAKSAEKGFPDFIHNFQADFIKIA